MLDTTLVPAANALVLLAFAREHALDTEALMARIGVDARTLAREDQWLTVKQCSQLTGLVREQSGVPGLGYELGMRTPATGHGLFSLGMLSSANPQAGLALAERFFLLRNPTFGMAWSVSDGEVHVILEDKMGGGPLRQTITEWVLLSMLRMGEAMLGLGAQERREAVSLSFTWARPGYHAGYARRLPPCRFDAPATGMHFPASWLGESLHGAAEASVQLATTACERDLALMGRPDTMAERVRTLLEKALSEGDLPSLGMVAQSLNMSVSTLKRRLLSEGCRFGALLDEVRWRGAQRMLRHGAMSVGDVAARLGYENTANFSRAFRQWSGMTPSAWRGQ